MGEFCKIPGNYLFKCYFEIFSPGYPDHIDLSCVRISAGIYYFQILREGAEFSHPYGYDPHVDQHAPSYLCMDEYSFRQWSGEQPSENAGNFTEHHDVYRFFGYCGPCL